MIGFAFFFASAVVLAFLLTPFAIGVARRVGAVDKPDPRKVHQTPVPRLGGLAIFGTVMLVMGLAAGLAPGIWERGPWPAVFVGALIVYLLGFTDDVNGLSPALKFAVQGCAAFAAVSSGLVLERIYVPGLGDLALGRLGPPLTIFWIVGVTNAFNLIDGLDGLAGGLGFIAAFAFFTLAGPNDPGVGVVSAALAGALAGFLRYNFHPARIFMGDSGSLFVGYLLACLAVRTSWGENSVGFAIPVLVVAVPLLDTATAMGRRYVAAVARRGRAALFEPKVMFQPDRGHIHHRLLDCGLTQRQAVSVLYLLAALLAALGVWARAADASITWGAVLGGAVLFFVVRIATGVPRRSRS